VSSSDTPDASDVRGQPARAAALDLLTTALSRRAGLEEGLNHPAMAKLEPRDRAFARALVMATLRHLGATDTVLQSRLKKAPPERIVNVLRLGAAQILVLKVPPHAAVGATVDLAAAQKGGETFKGLVNAVLRGFTREPPELNDPSPILEYARHAYDVIILDAGNVYGDWNLNQARLANDILLVTTNELPALQAAQRALSYMDANRVGRWKIRLLVNRYQREIGLSREVIGTALHTEVFDSIPSDYEAVQKALMEGKPVPANTAFGKSLTQVVERLGVRGDGSKKTSSRGGLLGLFSKTK